MRFSKFIFTCAITFFTVVTSYAAKPIKVGMPISKESKFIDLQMTMLKGVADTVKIYKVTPGTEEQMLKALSEQLEYEDFDWVGADDSSWEADSLSWGVTNLERAQAYVIGVLEQKLEENSENNVNKAKIQFADNYIISKKVFDSLKNVKGVKYGVSPTGAVQCGVSFAALLVLDTKEGYIYEIVMEGSGC